MAIWEAHGTGHGLPPAFARRKVTHPVRRQPYLVSPEFPQDLLRIFRSFNRDFSSIRGFRGSSRVLAGFPGVVSCANCSAKCTWGLYPAQVSSGPNGGHRRVKIAAWGVEKGSGVFYGPQQRLPAPLFAHANRNAFAERSVLSIKSECLRRLIPLGERRLHHAIDEYVAHYHVKRAHHGIGNELLDEIPQR